MDFKAARSLAFPKELILAAQHSERATGTPACVALAQWAHESAWGKYMSGRNNPFGIKGNALNGRLVKTWEEVNGLNVTVTTYFRNFANMQAAFEYHGRMLANPLGYYASARKFYHAAKDGEASWVKYVKTISPIYATDSAYAKKVSDIITRFHLYDYNLKRSVSNV